MLRELVREWLTTFGYEDQLIVLTKLVDFDWSGRQFFEYKLCLLVASDHIVVSVFKHECIVASSVINVVITYSGIVRVFAAKLIS